MSGHLLRIVPAKSDNPDAIVHMTRGTEVFAGDTKVKGVYRITLTAEVGNDVWRANIECYVEPPAEVLADGVVLINGAED